MPASETDEPLFQDDCLIEHAERAWKAEAENAERLSRRVNGLISAIVALFGLGLFRIEWYKRTSDVLRIQPPWVFYGMKVLIVLSIFAFVHALWVVVRKSPDETERIHSSELLSLPQEFIKRPGRSREYCRKVIFVATYQAYLDIQARNSKKAARLNRAQRPFFLGLAFVIATLILYVLLSDVHIIHSEAHDARISTSSQVEQP